MPQQHDRSITSAQSSRQFRLAIEVRTPSLFREPIETLERKLTHALYYRETGRALSKTHVFLSEFYQPQGSSDVLTKYLVGLFPDKTIGGRTNVKNYGERFGYKSGWKEVEDFFMYIPQFGRGLMRLGNRSRARHEDR